MKRYRITNPKRFTAFLTCIALLIVFAGGSVLGLYDASSKDATKYTSIEVQSGDTLWDLARTYGPENADIRETVYKICKLNNITADTLHAGLFITIPSN